MTYRRVEKLRHMHRNPAKRGLVPTKAGATDFVIIHAGQPPTGELHDIR